MLGQIAIAEGNEYLLVGQEIITRQFGSVLQLLTYTVSNKFFGIWPCRIFLFKDFFIYFIHHHCSLQTYQKRAPDPITDGYEPHVGAGN